MGAGRVSLSLSLPACLQLYLYVPDLKFFFLFRKKYSKVRPERIPSVHEVLEEGEKLLMVFAEHLS